MRDNFNTGFTLVEMLIVVVLIISAAAIAAPMFSSAAVVQVKSAASMISADLEYAKNLAISNQKTYTVVFNTSAESYQIENQNGVISHPVNKGTTYVVNFKNDSRLNKVDIAEANFDGNNQIKFDYIGNPRNADNDALNSGRIILNGGGVGMLIQVEPVTGYVTIQETH